MAESKCSEGDKRKVKSEANDESLLSSRVFVEGLRSANLSDTSVDDSSDDDDDDVPSEPPPSRKRAHSDSSSHDDAEAYGTVAKKFVRYANDMEPNFGENKAQKMMAKMGYKSGHGLGKHEQGRVAPIELSLQRGRRGLGLHLRGLEPANLVWNSDMEQISHEEEVAWFTHDPYEDVTYEDMCKWPVIGRKKLTIDDETNFCDPGVLKNVLSEKNVFDNLDGYELRKARSRSNPFETIRGGMFLNRAAMKMANMDRVFDNMFTKPVDEWGHSLVEPGELLYFADVCAGPGGFSEYVLWRCGWEAKGFGFTLKGENDFKLSDFYAGNCETFEPHYGFGGAEGDGDIFKPDNIDAFTKHVMSQTDGRGVHFMMADGGFSVEGQENIQEILSKELYLCQFIVALCIVCDKGHFVCKLFDLFTPFSVGLVYLISKAFQRISIHKPNTSRPANSERYIICQWRRPDFKLEPIREYLRYIHGKLHECQQQKDQDVVEIVPLSMLTEEGKFFDYMVTSNNVLGERQIVNLVKIASFCRDPNLMEPLQADMKQKCLQYWGVPDKSRTIPPRVSPEAKFTELLGSTKTSESVLGTGEEELTPGNLHAVLGSGFDWHCMVLGTCDEDRHRTLYLGMGRGKVFRLDGSRWRKVEESIELSPDTLLYAEMVAELLGEGRSQRKVMCLHILDALVLGGRHIGRHHLTERHALCHKFCRALNKPLRTPATHVRTKELFDLEAAELMFARLDARILKGCRQISRRVFLVDDGHRCYVPGGVLFLNATRPPWLRFLSKSTGFKYYNNPNTKTSLFDRERPDDACASFETSVKHRRVWWWGAGVHVHSVDAQEEDKDKLQGRQLLDFVNSMYPQPRAK